MNAVIYYILTLNPLYVIFCIWYISMRDIYLTADWTAPLSGITSLGISRGIFPVAISAGDRVIRT